MLKLTGLSIMALLLILTTFDKANKQLVRIKYLEKFERYVFTLMERIKIFKEPLDLAYAAAKEQVGFDFSVISKLDCFKESDNKLVFDYFNSIENRDLETIEKNTEYYLKKIKLILESDIKKAKENAKLLRILGILGAIFIFLFFI